MTGKYFIYAFDEKTRDLLIRAGYALFHADYAGNRYVFENRDDLRFAYDGLPVAFSNTLTF